MNRILLLYIPKFYQEEYYEVNSLMEKGWLMKLIIIFINLNFCNIAYYTFLIVGLFLLVISEHFGNVEVAVSKNAAEGNHNYL